MGSVKEILRCAQNRPCFAQVQARNPLQSVFVGQAGGSADHFRPLSETALSDGLKADKAVKARKPFRGGAHPRDTGKTSTHP